MLKVQVDYLTADEEIVLLLKYHQGFDADRLEALGLQQVATPEAVALCRQEIVAVTVDQSLLGYISQITRATRESPHLLLGCSPRASVMLLQAAKAFAAIQGRGYVNPDDVKALALPALRHRILLRPEADIEGLTADQVLASTIERIPVPR